MKSIKKDRNFLIEKHKDYVLIKVNNLQLNSLNSPMLKSIFVDLIREGEKTIIVDLERVTFMDSSGLSVLLTGNRLIDNDTRNGQLIIVAQNSTIMQSFQVAIVNSILNIEKSVEFAIKHMAENRRNSAPNK